MDSDRIAGAAKQVKGSIKEAIGKLTGNTKCPSGNRSSDLNRL
jgi:uncharacterized protein YjbJ (UPF0337 family)